MAGIVCQEVMKTSNEAGDIKKKKAQHKKGKWVAEDCWVVAPDVELSQRGGGVAV